MKKVVSTKIILRKTKETFLNKRVLLKSISILSQNFNKYLLRRFIAHVYAVVKHERFIYVTLEWVVSIRLTIPRNIHFSASEYLIAAYREQGEI